MLSIDLRFGPSVKLTDQDVAGWLMMRAFALVDPETWGRKDWREPISAVLHPADLEAAGVTIAAVRAAVAFFTATEATVREVPVYAEPATLAFVVQAPGYRAGPAA